MSLARVEQALRSAPARLRRASYSLPRLWCDPGGDAGAGTLGVDPVDFYSELIATLRSRRARRVRERDWSRRAVVYNLLVRHALAFDHDGDGEIGGAPGDPTLNRDGHRETGTLLKACAILPYLKRMGVNTLHLLPVTAIGRHGRKGELGSPYAIRNPERVEPTLADPLLGELSPEVQLRALTEACHRLGLRVVLEFVFRTAALDSDWIDTHPEWFYWIDSAVPNRRAGMADPRDGFGAPVFGRSELREIVGAVTGGGKGGTRSGRALARSVAAGFGRLHPPPPRYRRWFSPPPARVARNAEGEAIGAGMRGALRVPPAFADWPPDDTQPPWTDVTYLRMYQTEGFDYMAYNTLRAYDPALARPAHELRALWKRLCGIIPLYQRRFGIDGVMLDMGHALPPRLLGRLIDEARAVDPEVAIWEETFTVGRQSARNGYDAVVGELIFSAHRPSALRKFVRSLRRPTPVPFFATIENHNTPRGAARPAGGEVGFAAWALSLFLPGAIPFIHAGFDLEEGAPLNTGLDFDAGALRRWRGQPLGLFDRSGMSWTGGSDFGERIGRLLALRAEHAPALTQGRRPPVEEVATIGTGGVAFRVDGGAGSLLLAASLDGREAALIGACKGVDLWSGAVVDGGAVVLEPGRWMLLREDDSG